MGGSKVKRLLKYLSDGNERFYIHSKLGLHDKMPDEEFLTKMFQARLGYPLDLAHPLTFNEKLQWLKLNDRNPKHVTMVDKYAAKGYVTEKIGGQYVIPLLGVWDRFDDIPFDTLPDRFVLKCTHDSQGLVICKDKKNLDLRAAKKKIEKCMAYNFYYFGREWPYKDVPHRIIAEEYMEDSDGSGELSDYKIHCFGGQPKVIQVITNRFGSGGMINDHYDLEWNKLDLTRGHYVSSSTAALDRPPEMDEMLKLAKTLAEGEKYVRTDFYIIRHKVYFGELTFFPASGFNPFHPEEWDRRFGDWISLPTDQK